MESQKSPESTEGRTLSITRLLNAPRDLVWEVWTNPEHIKNWWGPEGFRNTIDKMEVRPGGEWQFTMHGPDGTDYRNVHVYVELVKPERIVLQHVTGPKFVMTATFAEETGGKTRVHLHSLFESAEQLAHVIQVFKADVGMKQNVDRLEAYLSEQSTNLSHSRRETKSAILETRYVLAVQNLAASVEHFQQKLGFITDWAYDGWQQLRRGSFVVMLGECPDDRSAFELRNHSYFAYVQVDGVDELYEELVAKGAEIHYPLGSKPWGMREFGIITIDGHRIMFGQEL